MVNVTLFIITCVLLIILPGPDTAIVTKNTVVGGRNAGMQTMIGSCIGLVIHTVAAVAGLSAIIVKSAIAFSILKYVGAAYLCYLGIRTLMNMRAKKNQVDEETLVVAKGNSFFKQGFITNITNPKVAVFFLTFL
ncbi:MAG: LysE family translocator, partial [Solibacillus sp.]